VTAAGVPVGAGMPVGRTTLGSQGLEVSTMGLGCMVLTRSYVDPDEAESRATVDRALELGVTFFDTANAYANGENETFVGQVIKGRRDRITLASKFGLVRAGRDGTEVNGRPDYIRACCQDSLQRLGTDHLDLYYQHRVDPDVPIEESVGAMAELVAAGHVRYLGLSEASVDVLRRAHAVHPISVLQSDWSLWARDIEAEVVPAARAMGVGIVPYSPLGRGFLAGAITAELAGADRRSPDPRFQGDNLEKNLRLLDELRQVADRVGATPAQVALAWLKAKGDDVVPIPGMERRDLLDENVGSLAVTLCADDLATLDRVFAPGVASGNPDHLLGKDLPPNRRAG